jgi:gluconolactonase
MVTRLWPGVTRSSPIRRIDRPPERSPFESYDTTFTPVVGEAPRLVQVVEIDAHEGPVYVRSEDSLYFTTLPRPGDLPAPGFPQVAIKRVALDGDRFPVSPERVSTVRAEGNVANGMTLAPDGRLFICEQGSLAQAARISAFDRVSGAVETVIDSWRGLPLNSPNDVVVKSDGTVWFTDPSYGHLQGFRPEPLVGDYVYRCDPRSGRTSVVADSFIKPNGLAFSPDETVLYIGDSAANQEPESYHPNLPHHIIAFDVKDGRRLAGDRLFAVTTPGVPDGIKVDADGRVYASASSGVQVFSPEGDLIGEIKLPGAVNFTFGGPEQNILFVTTDSAIWAAVLDARGPEPSTAKPDRRLKGA